MRIFGMIIGGLIALFGLSIILTPLRTYFLIGWITGCVLLCNGLPILFSAIRRKNRSRIIMGLITSIIGIILLVSDFQQVLTQVVMVYLIAGGIMLSGIIELIIGYITYKNTGKGKIALIFGGISFCIGLAGIIFKDATIYIIGVIVGYHIVRIGISVFMTARDINKPDIIDIDGRPLK